VIETAIADLAGKRLVFLRYTESQFRNRCDCEPEDVFAERWVGRIRGFCSFEALCATAAGATRSVFISPSAVVRKALMLSTRLCAASFLASSNCAASSVRQAGACSVSSASLGRTVSGAVLERNIENDGVFAGGDDDAICFPLFLLGIGTVLAWVALNLRSQPASVDCRLLSASSGSMYLMETAGEGGGPPELREMFMIVR
jgi:hypothetical protein